MSNLEVSFSLNIAQLMHSYLSVELLHHILLSLPLSTLLVLLPLSRRLNQVGTPLVYAFCRITSLTSLYSFIATVCNRSSTTHDYAPLVRSLIVHLHEFPSHLSHHPSKSACFPRALFRPCIQHLINLEYFSADLDKSNEVPLNAIAVSCPRLSHLSLLRLNHSVPSPYAENTEVPQQQRILRRKLETTRLLDYARALSPETNLLTHLRLYECNILDVNVLTAIACNSPRLESLELYTSPDGNNLDLHILKDDHIIPFAKSCPSLKELSLGQASCLTDKVLQALAEYSKHLKMLILWLPRRTKITVEELFNLIERVETLCHLGVHPDIKDIEYYAVIPKIVRNDILKF